MYCDRVGSFARSLPSSPAFHHLPQLVFAFVLGSARLLRADIPDAVLFYMVLRAFARTPFCRWSWTCRQVVLFTFAAATLRVD